MTRKELLVYMLEHRNDNEAFHIFMHKVHAEPLTEIYPAPKTIDDLKHFPQLLEEHRKEREQNA